MRAGRFAANGTTLYAEIRGEGPPILFIHGGIEDADDWRALADRCTGHTVVTYDRRGTGRSGNEDWPGRGTVQHAHDAAGLLHELGLEHVTVFGSSSGAMVALRLTLLHAARVVRTIAWEPAAITMAPDGTALHRALRSAAGDHLLDRPNDWRGALDSVWRAWDAKLGGRDDLPDDKGPSERDHDDGGGADDAREASLAETFLKDDLPILSAESFDGADIAGAQSEIRFAYGSSTHPLFPAIARILASMRGVRADEVSAASHDAQESPEAVGDYLALCMGSDPTLP